MYPKNKVYRPKAMAKPRLRRNQKLTHAQPQLPSPEEFYWKEIRDLKEYGDRWAWGLCPFHEDRSPSLAVNLESGGFKCMSAGCGVSGGSIVSFVSELHGISRAEAMIFLEEWQWKNV